jgi:hypothetical protein
MPSTGQD